MKNYTRLLAYMRPYVKKFGLAIVCIILASAANLYVPWIIKDMIDDVLADKNMALLNAICIGIVVISCAGFFILGSPTSSPTLDKRSSSTCVRSCSANSSACRSRTTTATRRERS